MQQQFWLIFTCTALILSILSVGCRRVEDTSAVTSPTAGSIHAESTAASRQITASSESEETKPDTQPSTEPTTEPTSEPTETSSTVPPTELATQPVTEPITEPPTAPPTEPDNGDELIGSLYTRNDLYNIDNTNYGYGPGSSADGKRPATAVSLENQFGSKYDAHFIAPDNGKVYLTFSLGYEYNQLTARILDTLKEKGVKGVFFINLHYAQANYDLVRRMIDEGHIVANHTCYHYTLADLSIDRVVKEIMRLHEYVLDTYGYEMTMFRPPSGYYSERVLAIAQSLGYSTVNWSFAYRDWEDTNQPDIDSSREKLIDCAHSGAIYALHTVSETNAAILGDVIDAIRAKGYEFALYTGE